MNLSNISGRNTEALSVLIYKGFFMSNGCFYDLSIIGPDEDLNEKYILKVKNHTEATPQYLHIKDKILSLNSDITLNPNSSITIIFLNTIIAAAHSNKPR